MWSFPFQGTKFSCWNIHLSLLKLLNKLLWCVKFMSRDSSRFAVFQPKILARSSQFPFSIIGKFTQALKGHPWRSFIFETSRIKDKHFFSFLFLTFLIMLGYDLNIDLAFNLCSFFREGCFIVFIGDFCFRRFSLSFLPPSGYFSHSDPLSFFIIFLWLLLNLQFKMFYPYFQNLFKCFICSIFYFIR